MAQWVNRLRNNIFINPPPLPLLCEISGALHLAQPGLMAGWLAGWLADEIQVNFEIFKVGCRLKYSTCRFVGSVGIYDTCRISITGFDNIIIASYYIKLC